MGLPGLFTLKAYRYGRFNLVLEFFRGLDVFYGYVWTLGRYPSLEFQTSNKSLNVVLDSLESYVDSRKLIAEY